MSLGKLKIFFLNKIANLFMKAVAYSDFVVPENGFMYTDLRTLKDDDKDKVIYPQDYGIYSIPMADAECFVCFPNGSRDEGIILRAAHTKYAPKEGAPGDIILLHYKGTKVHISENDGIEIDVAESKPVTIKAKNVDIELESGGKFTVAGDNLTVDA